MAQLRALEGIPCRLSAVLPFPLSPGNVSVCNDAASHGNKTCSVSPLSPSLFSLSLSPFGKRASRETPFPRASFSRARSRRDLPRKILLATSRRRNPSVRKQRDYQRAPGFPSRFTIPLRGALDDRNGGFTYYFGSLHSFAFMTLLLKFFTSRTRGSSFAIITFPFVSIFVTTFPLICNFDEHRFLLIRSAIYLGRSSF